eukprot:jgi/Ulvmu1/292/UM001_0296.1
MAVEWQAGTGGETQPKCTLGGQERVPAAAVANWVWRGVATPARGIRICLRASSRLPREGQGRAWGVLGRTWAPPQQPNGTGGWAEQARQAGMRAAQWQQQRQSGGRHTAHAARSTQHTRHTEIQRRISSARGEASTQHTAQGTAQAPTLLPP